MTSKIVVNNIESDAGVSTVFFNSDIGGTGGTLNVDGNLNVDGVLSYEDVTNIDSVGIITARDGIRVTSGEVGIDNATPHRKLVVGGGGDIACFGANGGIYFGTSTGGFRNNGAIARAQQAGYHVSGSQIGDLVMAPEADKDLIFSSGGSSTMYERLRITTGGDVQARRARSNTAGDVALSIQPSDSAIHYGFRIDSANNNLNIDRVGTGNFITISAAGNVGINDTAPSQKLNVGGNIMLEGSDQYLYLTNVGTGNAGMYIRGRDATSELRSHSTGMFTWEVIGGEKMRLTSDGYLGINETSPDRRLHINSGATDTALKLESTDVEVSLELADNTGSSYIGGGGNYLNFYSGGSERIRITSTGDVGINCTPHSNAGINLHIHGDNTTSEIRLTNTTTGTGANGSYIQQGGNTLYIGNTESGNTVFEVNGSERVRINSVGNMGIGGEPLPTSTGYDGATLHLRQSANSGGSALRMTNGSTGHTTSDGFYMGYWQDGHLYFYNQEAGHMIFGTNSTERLRINSTGLVSLGGEPSSGAGLLNLKPSSGDEYLKIRDAGDFNASLNGVALDIRNSANTASKDLVVRSQNLVLWQSGSEQLRITENGRVLINRTTATDQNITNLSSDVKLVVNGSTITKHGYKADVGTSYVSIPGASLGNESSVYIVTVQGNGGGNFHSTATYILCSGAYNKTFTQLGSASNHFGNGVIQAQLSSYSGTSSSVQARRSGSSGTCSVQVHMLKLI